MSIAVSVLVRPSRTHRLLLAAATLGQCALAVAMAPWTALVPVASPALALFPALAAGILAVAAVRRPKPHHIDISGIGELRVTVQQGLRVAPVARLLPGSVVWSPLMVLRWQAPGAPPRTLLVWRDAVDPPAWRALAVALAAIGRRTKSDTNLH